MNKRGQLTLFIIIAIIIIALIILVIFFQRGFPGAGLTEGEIATVKGYLDNCFELKTKEGIIFLGRQGGYYFLDGVESINFLDEQTAYYWKDNQSLIPSTETIASELDKYLNEYVNECFLSPEVSEYDFDGTCTATSQVSETINVNFNCPVTVRKGTSTTTLEIFTINFDAPVTKLLNVSNQIFEEYEKKPGYVCISCFDEIATQNNVTITAAPITSDIFEPEHIWFLITDKNIKFEDKDIKWRFVIEL